MRKGIQCTIVNDGNSAIHALSNEKYDVLISDLLLSYKSGIEVTFFAKETINKPFCIIMTRIHADHFRKLAMEIGADAYFNSPFDFEEIHDHIIKYVK